MIWIIWGWYNPEVSCVLGFVGVVLFLGFGFGMEFVMDCCSGFTLFVLIVGVILGFVLDCWFALGYAVSAGWPATFWIFLGMVGCWPCELDWSFYRC